MLRSRLFAIVLPVLVVGGLLSCGWLWLRFYTRHNVTMRVPDLKGLSFAEAGTMLEARQLRALVIDSVYTDELPKGSIVEQDPIAGVDVKPGRKVYLVLNASEPKMIDMPRLVDLSKRQAISVLEIIGLKVKELQYRPDPCVDCVIAQLYNGAPIAADARIRRGEAITLVLGSGDKGQRVPVPDLIGLTNAEVQMVLNMASLNLGVVVECETCNTSADSTLARVRRQSPAANANDRIALGSTIDIWLTADTAGLKPAAGWNDPNRYQGTDTVENAE
ncbi:MAG TPA: PASTA domain-containing protein [Flavobacteriales bacterium]|nr:PASTA domain-containing protein [Flavobacteriales bacterium]